MSIPTYVRVNVRNRTREGENICSLLSEHHGPLYCGPTSNGAVSVSREEAGGNFDTEVVGTGKS